MLLRNFYKYSAIQTMFGETYPIKVTNTSGQEKETYASYYGYNIGNSMQKTTLNTSHSDWGIIIGSNTTPPTFDDYKLYSILTTFSSTVSNIKSVSDDGVVTFTSNITVVNTTANEITIGEIGLMVDTNPNASGNGSLRILVERTVLDTPITLQPNEVGQITYTISYQMKTE